MPFSHRFGEWSSVRPALSLAAIGVLATGCRHDAPVAPQAADWSLSAASGNLQRVPAGSTLPQALGVKLLGPGGAPVKGARVVFAVERGVAGGSALTDTVAITGPDGVAATGLRVGAAFDTTVVVAYPSLARSRSVTLMAFATAAPSIVAAEPASFATGDTVRIRGAGLAAVGGGSVVFGDSRVPVLPGATDSLLRAVVPACLPEGALTLKALAGTVQSNSISATYRAQGAPAAVPRFGAITVAGSALASCLRLAGDGAAYMITPQFAAVGASTASSDWRLGSTVVRVASLADNQAARVADNPRQRELEGILRSRERAIAAEARAQAMRAVRPVVQAQGVTLPPPVGSARSFNVVSKLDGSRFTSVTARLRYVGEHLLLYVDSVGQGFTDSQYTALGALFDRDLYPLGIAAFGSESDLDGNGRVIVLFTPVVNSLSPAPCGNQGFVTGFFYSSDLLLQSASSNRGEIFYSFIPDPAGAYSCPHTADFVQRTLPGTFLHELQHMISFNQHVLARGGEPEATWLNEGLSHFAEELGARYYEAKFPYPSGRSSPDQIFPDSAGNFITPQLLNAYVYLNGTRVHSVTTYDGGGSIEDRGATWLFLRWLAAQKGDSVVTRLEQTSKTGAANVEDKAGEPFAALFADFSVALQADSLLGVPRAQVSGRYQFGAARNLRRMMFRLALVEGFPNPWPLPLYALRAGGSLQSSMRPGTMVHSLLQTRPGDPGLVFGFTRPDGSPFNVSDGAQVSIFRLSP